MESKATSKKNWEKVRELMEHHRATFDSVGVKYTGAQYIPKMFYKPPGKEELHVSFFMSELQRGQDIYTEMVNRDYESEDPSRTLYKLPYNPLWKTQYQETDTAPVRYLVPMSELVAIGIKPTDDGVRYDEDCIGDDCSIAELTIRDLYAIIQNKAVSHKKWLNELIRP